MTNPENAIGTNGAYNGRTSVNAFNDDLAIYNGRGIISGFACQPSSGMTVTVGGSGTVRDVAVAQNPSGDRTTVNNRLGSPVEVILPNAPASNSRIDSIVAYVDGTPQGEPTVADNPGACGIIVVSGAVASSPSAPTESQIRSAITADGASGANAYYVVLANVRVSSGTTNITANMITQGGIVKVDIGKLDIKTNIGGVLNLTARTIAATTTWGGVEGFGNFEKGKYLFIINGTIRQNSGYNRGCYWRFQTSSGNLSTETMISTQPESTLYWNSYVSVHYLDITADVAGVGLYINSETNQNYNISNTAVFYIKIG